MNVRLDTVLDMDNKVLFQGNTDDTVKFLEVADPFETWWVSIGETGDLLPASQYLDLATDDIVGQLVDVDPPCRLGWGWE